MMPPDGLPLQKIAMVLVVTAVVAFVGLQVVSASTSENMEEYMIESKQWCNSHNGDLVNSNVLGSHGGLHCDLPNGTSVHMQNVIMVNNTA